MPSAVWMTPSWQTNRRGVYMTTEQQRQHPWLREDVGLRACLAAREFGRAAALLTQAVHAASDRQGDIRLQRLDVEHAAQIARSFGESLLAHRADG